MYIKKVKIIGFRNFRELEVELKKFSFIVGENNVGKTNLLEAICLVLGSDISTSRKRLLSAEDINLEIANDFRKNVADTSVEISNIEFPEIRVELSFTELSSNDNQEATMAHWHTDQGLEEAKLTYLFSLKESWTKKKRRGWLEEQRDKVRKSEWQTVDLPIEQYRYDIYGGESEKGADVNDLRMLKMEILDALRDAHRELVGGNNSRLLFRILNHRDHEKYGDIKDLLRNLQSAIDSQEELNNVKSELTKYLEKVSLAELEHDNSIDFRLSAPQTTEILRRLSIMYGGSSLSVDRNGLGRNNLLYIALVLSHFSKANEMGENVVFRVIGIEEAEAHLHPHLQIHLARNIEGEVSDEQQIILSTHSPYISSMLNVENMIILYKNSQGNVESYSLSENIKEPSTRSYLRKFIDATNSQIFFARKVIFIEGIAEELLIPQFFYLHTDGEWLEKYGCNLVNIRGLAFKRFLDIIKSGYFIKALALTDKDKKGERATKLKEDYEEENGVIHVGITDQSTFEKDLVDANKEDEDGKIIIVDALQKTFPNKNLSAIYDKDSNLIVNKLYGFIENSKSEFALHLLEEIQGSSKKILIPSYIEDGFNFLLEGDDNIK